MNRKQNNTLALNSFLLAFITLFFASCDNDLDMSTDRTSLPVVYAILSPKDSSNVIRVQRSFSGNNNAAIGANSADSIYFSEILVEVDFYTPDGFLLITERFDRRLFSDKDPGYFCGGPYEIYFSDLFFSNYLLPDSYIILSLLSPGNRVIASCRLVYFNPPEILSPKPGISTYLSLFAKQPLEITWTDRSCFTEYDVNVLFLYNSIYQDRVIADTTIIPFHCISNSTIPDYQHPRLTLPINGESFFPKLAAKIRNDDAIDYRVFKCIYFELITANPEFYDYVRFKSISNYGNVNNFTNIIGGLGICTFEYKTKSSKYILDLQSMDSLVQGRFTKGLNFVNW